MQDSKPGHQARAFSVFRFCFPESLFSTFTAQTLSSGILATGSRASLVRMLAAASRKWKVMNTVPGRERSVTTVLAVTVQWGVVTTKLDHVEQRLDELLVEARALRTEYQSIERRVSFLEGRLNGRDEP